MTIPIMRSFSMVRISDIQNNKVLWEKVPYCIIEEKDIETYLLEVNDILFARTGGTVGKSFLVEEVPEPAIYAGYLIRTRYSQELCPQYLKSFMESQLYWEQLKSGTIATAQPNCNGKTLGRILLPIPPKAEQIRLVQKLTSLIPVLYRYAKTQQDLDNLNEVINDKLKKSILQEAIQGKLVPQFSEEGTAHELLDQIQQEKQKLVKEGKLKKSTLTNSVIYKSDDNKYYEQIDKETKEITEDILFDLPNKWQWCRIGTIFMHNNGKQLNKGNSKGKLMKYITTSNLYWDGFVLDNLKEMPFENNEIDRCMAVKGDLLVCEGGDIGRSCIWNYDFPIMLQNHIHKLRPYIPLCTKFFYYIFNLYNLAGLIGGKGIGIQGFSSKALHNTLVPLPPLKDTVPKSVSEIG